MAQVRSSGKAALICGSVAYDTILQFPDRFKSHILPDKIHILNVSFLVPEMRREFGVGAVRGEIVGRALSSSPGGSP